MKEYGVEVGWSLSRLVLVRARSAEAAARAAEDWIEENVSYDERFDELQLYSTKWDPAKIAVSPDVVITAPEPEEPE